MLKIFDLINEYIQANLPFVSYRLPNETQVISLLSNNSDLVYGSQVFENNEPGFVFAPFNHAKEYAVKLIPNSIIEGIEPDSNVIPEFNHQHKAQTIEITEQANKDKSVYTKAFNQSIQEIESGTIQKIVLSTVEKVSLELNHNYSAVYKSLLELYPRAFVYILYTPKTGLWTGATPETLLEVSGNKISTMALASTRKINGAHTINWNEKEIHEHKFVKDFVKEKLRNIGIHSLHEGELETVQAGSMFHLKTEFRGELQNNDVLKAALELHPTPAVCGTPTEKARELINTYEAHNREFYTGFLGPVLLQKKSRLYVNLRCAKMGNNEALLFAGGGIVKHSDVESEWNELELKLNTMKKAITHSQKQSKNIEKHAS